MNEARITILCDNTARGRGLLGEHGLAYWIEIAAHRALFDTGQGLALTANADALGIDVAQADAIVLSHGHYDHSGALAWAMDRATTARVYFHPAAEQTRYTRHKAAVREIGLGPEAKHALVQAAQRVCRSAAPQQVIPGLWTTGEIPRQTDYEDTGGDFCLDAAGAVVDPIVDDQALYLDSVNGLVVLLGCAHAGVVNTLLHVRRLTGRPVHAVLGGMHLLHANPRRINATMAALRELEVQVLAPGHCTGARAVAALWSGFPDQMRDFHVGARWAFAMAPEPE